MVAATAGAQSGVVGAAVPEPPAVRILSASGQPVAGIAVVFTVGSGGGTVTGATQATGSDGLASVGSWILGTAIGTYTLLASASGAAGSAVTFTATAAAASPATVAIHAGDAQSAIVNTAVLVRPAVIVKDTFGNPVAAVPVMFEVASGGGAIAGATQTTGADGVATAGDWALGAAEGVNTLTASVGALQPVTFSATALRPPDFALTGLTATQVVQRDNGTVPLVVGGNPVLLNIFGTVDRAPPPGHPRAAVRVRVFRDDAEVFTDERPLSGTFGTAGTPVHQIILPASIVAPGLRVLATINPSGELPEESLADNSWPRTGDPLPVAVAHVPPLPLHFVPIHLTVGGSVGTVSAATLPEYLYATRQMHPVAAIDVTIGSALSVDVSFGNGDAAAWSPILQRLDVLRVLEGTPNYYIGAVRPPPGVTFVTFGGFAYVPADPGSAGPGTRTAAVVNVGWFNRQRATTELVAHELGHTMGLRHAPCGSPSNPDLQFPYTDGSIGAHGYDLFSSTQLGGGMPEYHAPAAARDVMSYCVPAWISDYHYEKLLAVRGSIVGTGAPVGARFQAARETDPTCECLLVWGSVENGRITLQPTFAVTARQALPSGRGSYVLEGLGADGATLFSYRFEPTALDHAPHMRHFTFAIPADASAQRRLARIRVSGPGSSAALSASGGRAIEDISSDEIRRLVALRRTAGRAVELRWDRGEVHGVIARDGSTGAIIGIGTSGFLRLPDTGGEIEVIVSSGVRSRSVRLRGD